MREPLARAAFLAACLLCAAFAYSQDALPVPDGEAPKGYDSGGKRDPFLPLVTGEKRPAKMGIELVETVEDVRLEGIIVDSGGLSMAVINDTLMKEGETQYAVALKKVEKNAVLLTIHDTEYKVYLVTEGGE